MASCCRRYRARRLKALGHDPQLLVIRPAPPATSLDHLKPFKLSTALMAVHKDCYAPIGLIQQGGPRRRETMKFGFIAKHRTIWPVAWLCEAMGVSRSGFHAWLDRSPSARSRSDEAVGQQV